MLKKAALVSLWWRTDPGCFAHIPRTTTMPKAKAQNLGPPMGHCKLYLKCALEELQVILQLIKWNKIPSSISHPKGGEHYSPEPWKIKYNGGRLSPTLGKWSLVGIYRTSS